MSSFCFPRQDIWYGQFMVWKRRYVGWIGKPGVTVVLLLLGVYLYQLVPFSTTIDGSDFEARGTEVARQQGKKSRITKPQQFTAASARKPDSPRAAIVLLAPQRRAESLWDIDRFCFLRRAVRSIDRHLNAHHGPYPIVILVAKDHARDPTNQDGPYTREDRSSVELWTSHSTLEWHEIDMYSNDALEPNVSLAQILRWRRGQDGGQDGRPLGYQSMCRLYSGRLQNLPLLDGFEFYMRLDDDSLLTSDLAYDPFQKMQKHNLTYVYRREATDNWGVEELWKVAQPYVLDPVILPSNVATRRSYLHAVNGDGTDDNPKYIYTGYQPYNNFHISRVDFWRSTKWKRFMTDMGDHHLFMRHRVGDANVHAMALLMMGDDYIEKWADLPYAHNSNDMGTAWGHKEWMAECDSA